MSNRMRRPRQPRPRTAAKPRKNKKARRAHCRTGPKPGFPGSSGTTVRAKRFLPTPQGVVAKHAFSGQCGTVDDLTFAQAKRIRDKGESCAIRLYLEICR